MNNILSAMGYGDCLITLSLLEQLDERETHIRVLGTEATQRVSNLLRIPVPVIPLIRDIAAFYTVKEKGLSQSLTDYLSIRRSMRQIVQPGDRLGFERHMLTHRLLLPRGVIPVWPSATHSAYDDRKELVYELCGAAHTWKPCSRLGRSPQRALLNPSARYANRRLDIGTMENLLVEAKMRGWEVTLLDPERQYGHFDARVAHYIPEPNLEAAVTLLRESEFYIGPDSFFMHLAYYSNISFLCFFLPNWHVFMPPGVREIGNWLSFDDARSKVLLRRKLDEIGA